MRKLILGAAIAALAAAPAVVIETHVAADQADSSQEASEQEYVVVYTEGVSLDAARAAVAAAGGTIVSENTDVGVATVVTTNGDFAAAADAQDALVGAAHNRVIGTAPDLTVDAGQVQKFDAAEADAQLSDGASSQGQGGGHHGRPAEPLADLQWDMQQIGATVDGSYRFEKGKSGVLVGIIDTGIDGSHPDIAPNFNAELSRNFTTDIPVDANGDEVDGPCEYAGCVDPSDVDHDGHGTHVASIIGSPINGLGIAGVAPKVTLVNIRAGQDSGFFFLQPSVDALTYAGRAGIDVVNMSYYVDPWLFNCSNHPADSPEDQAEQRLIVTAMQRALDFAHRRGVTLVAAAGNGGTDYTKVISDASSPDFADVPGEVSYLREMLDPATCISMPSEGRHVISVSATGISTRKSYYSDYGNGYIDVAAPGGDTYDTPTQFRDVTKAVLAAYPESLGLENGWIDPITGEPTVANVVKSCDAAGTCAYYQYLQGTSMASPHAVGVAALIVSKYGHRDWRNGGRTLAPDVVGWILRATATKTPCPVPPAFTYTRNVVIDGVTTVVTATHVCEGTRWSNGFYGKGIINASRAVGH